MRELIEGVAIDKEALVWGVSMKVEEEVNSINWV